MSRMSEILKYPPELLAFINQCIDDPKITYLEAVDLVNKLIVDKYLEEKEVTHSSLGRYAKKRRENFEAAVQQMQRQKAQRKEFFERFGDDGLDNAGRYAAEMSFSMIMELQSIAASMQPDEDGEPMSIGEMSERSKIIQRITASIGNLEKSLSENKSRNDQIKAEAKAEALKAASDSVEASLKQDGASAETIQRIKEDLLNLNKAEA